MVVTSFLIGLDFPLICLSLLISFDKDLFFLMCHFGLPNVGNYSEELLRFENAHSMLCLEMLPHFSNLFYNLQDSGILELNKNFEFSNSFKTPT